MSNLSRFLKQNKKQRETVKYAPTKALVDDKGNPLEWTIKPITTKQNDDIRDSCVIEVPVSAKKGVYRNKFNASLYQAKLLVASTVEPNLYDAELQDSYGVKTPEELVKEMVDNPGEYGDFIQFVTKFNGFDDTIDDKVEEAKN